MAKYQILITALIVLSMFGIVTSVAFGEVVFLLAEWLVNGSGVTEIIGVGAVSSGELLLEDTKTIVGKMMVLCSGIFDETIKTNGTGVVWELLSLSGVAIGSSALGASALSCVDQENCESPKVWTVNLLWTTELVLMEESGASYFARLITLLKSGWYVECTVLGIKGSDECLAEGSVAEARNVMSGVELVTSEAFTELAGLKLATCTSSKEQSGIIEGSIIEQAAASGASLSVSSE
ncbi:MAG: hypothetical protein WBQ21_06310 [Solirubrobacteraceae bacterium]